MLRDFIAVHREEILAQARARAATRTSPVATELAHGLPVFLDQLGEALRRVTGLEAADQTDIKTSGGHLGDHLFRQGLTVGQVINGYGDLCQVITGLAVDRRAAIPADEFRTLNLCLDDATASAVTAYSAQRERAIAGEGTERLGRLAHELRNALTAAILLFGFIKKGTAATAGSTSVMMDRSLMRLQALIDRSLADVRLEAGLLTLARVPMWEVLEEAEISGAILAQARGLHLTVATVDPSVIVEADRAILSAAVANLLQNAFKFTRPNTTVKLRASTTASRVLIEVEDECGGLPPGSAERLLEPFVQRGDDRTGLGLGLSICCKAATMMAGQLHVRDLPGKGCIFTIDLPKQPPPPTSIHAQERKPRDGQESREGKKARSV